MKYGLAALLLVILLGSAVAQTSEQPAPLTPDPLRSLYLGAYAGRYTFWSELFNFDNDLIKHSGDLTGSSRTFDAEYPLTRTWSLYGNISRLSGSTNGNFLTESGVQSAAQTGQILTNVNGYIHFATRHYTFGGKKYFPLGRRFSPFINFGVGRGDLADHFVGQANITVPGYGATTQPALDRGNNHIWTPVFGAGLNTRITRNLHVEIMGQWDTGWCVSAGPQFRFDYKDPVKLPVRLFKKIF